MQSKGSVQPEQAAPPQVAGGAQFSGTIAELSVADLIQILMLAGKDAVITITRDGLISHVWCAAGAIVDAESGLLHGVAALYRILGFEHGSLLATLRHVPRERRIFVNTPRLLLESARHKDESDRLRAKLGGEQRGYRLAGGEPEPAGLSALELALLGSLAETRSVSQILASSAQGELETLTLLTHWLEAGMLADAGEQPVPALTAGSAAASDASQPSAAPQALVVRFEPGLPSLLRRVTLSWQWGVLAAFVLIPSGYLLGSGVAHTLVARAARASRPVTTAAIVEAATPSYQLQLEVEPAVARVVLDGELSGVGHLEARLPRNGVVHELRVTAPGFIPTSVRFLDTPPPQQLRLDPLPLPAMADELPVLLRASELPLANWDDADGPRRKLPHKRARATRGTLRRDRSAGTAPVRTQTSVAAPGATGPRIPVSDEHAPVIQLIN